MNTETSTQERTPGSLHPACSTAARVETNLRGTMVMISVGSQEVWLTRDEALAVCDALPSAINKMPVEV